MKMIVAYFQPFMEARVMEAIHGMEEVSGAGFELVRGFGRGRLKSGQERGLLMTGSKVRLEIVVADRDAPAVCRAIQAAAHTGKPGDGKIFLLPLENAIRISTGEEGGGAI